MKQNFCPECGQKTVRKYPCDDPENGPREAHCPEHGSINQMCIQWAWAHDMYSRDEDEEDRTPAEEGYCPPFGV